MEDKLLIWKLNCGRQDALCRIYEKYRDALVRIAAGLLNDTGAAEDIVQDVFLRLVSSANKYEVKKNLKAYLTTCVINKARNFIRAKKPLSLISIDDAEPAASNFESPDHGVICEEDFQNLYNAMAQLPYEQKEAVILHIQAKMKFRQIAELQQASIKTTMSRYNYGLNKLRSILNNEVLK